MKEVAQFENDPPEDISAGPVEGNLFLWNGVIVGPSGTPYEGGAFFVKIEFPPNYPFAEPKLTMTTTIYHPNVDKTGKVCTKALWGEKYPVSMMISQVLMTLYDLLKKPDWDTIINEEVAAAVKNDKNKENFSEMAKQMTKKHAS